MQSITNVFANPDQSPCIPLFFWPGRSRSSSSSPPPPRLGRPRKRTVARRPAAAFASRSAVTPTPTPTVTPSQTPPGTPTRTPPGSGLRGDSGLHAGLPPVPAFSSRFSPACASATAAAAKKGGRSPFAGQGAPFSGEAGGRARGGRDVAGERRGGVLAAAAAEPGLVQQDQAIHTCSREGPSIESEVNRVGFRRTRSLVCNGSVKNCSTYATDTCLFYEAYRNTAPSQVVGEFQFSMALFRCFLPDSLASYGLNERP